MMLVDARRSNGCSAARRAVFLLGMTFAALQPVIAVADNTNVYDASGRLVQVITSTGASAIYTYDAAGNLIKTIPSAPGTVAIATYSPGTALPGTSITINGSGFSANPTGNVVTIGGVTATVTAATSNTLTVTIPASVPNGDISVSVGGGPAVVVPGFFSITPSFQVDGPSVQRRFFNGGTLSIPFQGTAGQRLSLGVTDYSGSLATGLANVKILKPDGTLLSDCGSGYVPVGGVCEFANDTPLAVSGTYVLTVTPGVANTGQATFTLSSVLIDTLSASASTPTVLSSSRPGQVERLNFSGTTGQTVTIAWSSATAVPSQTQLGLMNPNGSWSNTSALNVGFAKPNGYFRKLLAQTGTFTVKVSPWDLQSASTFGNLKVQLLGASSGSLTLDGPATTATFASGDMPKLYTFSGTAGQRITLGVTGYAGTVTTGLESVLILKPDGSTLTDCGAGYPGIGGVCEVANDTPLPITGTYSLLMVPGGTNMGQVNFTLSSVIVDTLPPNATSPTFVSSSRAGQVERLNFSGTTGQTVTIGWSGATANPSQTQLGLMNPSGSWSNTSMLNIGVAKPNGYFRKLLAQTGTFTLKVSPWGLQTGTTIGNLNVQLLGAPSGTLTVDGPATTATFASGDMPKLYTFSGTAGQRVTLGVTGYSGTVPAGLESVLILKSDGSTLTDCGTGYSGIGGVCEVANDTPLPATGTYSLLMVPGGANTGQVTFTLSSVIVDTLPTNAISPTFVSSSRAGQVERLNFAGTSGQTVTLAWSGATANPSATQLGVMNPSNSWSGKSALGIGVAKPNGTLQVPLTQTGTFFVKVTPWDLRSSSTIGSLNVKLLGAPSGTLSLDGAATTATFTSGEMPKLYTFAGTAGQRITLGVTGYSGTVGTGLERVLVLKPDGSTLTDCGTGYSGIGGVCEVANDTALPVTGTYSLLMTQGGTNTGQVTFTLSSVMVDTLTVNAASPTTVASSRAGQVARLNFSGTSGQTVTVTWSGATANPSVTQLGVMNPSNSWSGKSATGIGVAKPSGTLQVPLTQTGTFFIKVTPWDLRSSTTIGTLGVRVTTP